MYDGCAGTPGIVKLDGELSTCTSDEGKVDLIGSGESTLSSD